MNVSENMVAFLTCIGVRCLYPDILVENQTCKQKIAFMCIVPCIVSRVEDNIIYFSPLFFPLTQNYFGRQVVWFLVNPLIQQFKKKKKAFEYSY